MRNFGFIIIENNHHTNIIKGLETNPYVRLDCLVALKAMIGTTELSIGPLVQKGLFQALMKAISSYRFVEEPLSTAYGLDDEFADLVMASLATELFCQVLESGFTNRASHENVFEGGFNGSELFLLKDICEMLVQDEFFVHRAAKSSVISFLCVKNVRLEKISIRVESWSFKQIEPLHFL